MLCWQEYSAQHTYKHLVFQQLKYMNKYDFPSIFIIRHFKYFCCSTHFTFPVQNKRNNLFRVEQLIVCYGEIFDHNASGISFMASTDLGTIRHWKCFGVLETVLIYQHSLLVLNNSQIPNVSNLKFYGRNNILSTCINRW